MAATAEEIMTARDLVADVGHLFTLPEVCLRVNQLLDDPQATPAALGAVVAYDPDLTARLLKLVNSPLHGLSARIETVPHAIALLGMEELRQLVLATAAVEAFRGIPVEVLDMASYWSHSVFCALTARALAADREPARRERYFTAGLLHDVGHLVLYSRVPELMRLVLEEARTGGRHRDVVERDVLGFDHAEVGAELIRSWGFPPGLWALVRYHHAPGEAGEHRLPAAVVHIANGLAEGVEPAIRAPGLPGPLQEEIPTEAWEMAGLAPEVGQPTVADVSDQMMTVLDLLTPEHA